MPKGANCLLKTRNEDPFFVMNHLKHGDTGRWSLHWMLNAPHNKRCEKAREKWKNDCLNLIECSTSDKDKEREKFFKQKAILLLCIYDFMRILVTKSGGSTFSIFNSEIGGKYIYRYIWVENTSINHVWNTCVLNQLILLRCFACEWGGGDITNPLNLLIIRV